MCESVWQYQEVCHCNCIDVDEDVPSGYLSLVFVKGSDDSTLSGYCGNWNMSV